MKNTIYYLMLFCCLYLVGGTSMPAFAEGDGHEHDHQKEESHVAHDDHRGHAGNHEGKDTEEKEVALRLSTEQLEEFDIVTKSAGPGVIEQYVDVPGEVVVNQETLSHISARFPGVV